MTQPPQGPPPGPFTPPGPPPPPPGWPSGPHPGGPPAGYPGGPGGPGPFAGPPSGPGMPPVPMPGPGGYQLPPPPPPPAPNALLPTVLSVASLALIVIGLSVEENDVSNWHNYKSWGGVAIAAALLTMAGLIAPKLGWTNRLAWQLSALGAGLLVFFWVLFVVPDIQKNTSLVLSLGVVAGVAAVWLLPGRESAALAQREASGPVGPRGDGPPGGHMW